MKSHCPLALLITLLLSLVALALPARSAAAAGVHYATPTGTGDCSSWAQACTLQTALLGASAGDQIWVMQGTHKPGTTRDVTFQMRNGVALYGGFTGDEDSLDDRDFSHNVTILSGNVGEPGFYSDNSYHVVTGSGMDATAILDGFTVTEGYADGPTTASYGGGMYNANGSPTVSNVTFIENHSDDDYGGGMYNNASSPTLNNVVFSSNSAYSGGGMYNANDSRPTLTNVTFTNNWTIRFGDGGGMKNDASCPTLIDVNFFSNTTSGSGGGMHSFGGFGAPDCSPTLINVTFSGNLSDYGGGGMANDQCSPTLMNVTFSDNIAPYGGGMYNYRSDPLLIHITLDHNNAFEDEGGGIYNYDSSPVLANTILWGNTGFTPAYAQIYNFDSEPIIRYSVVQGGCPEESDCANLIAADPKLGVLDDWGGATLTVPLLPGSSAIDAAHPSLCPETDQRSVTRPQGFGCDIGAFEVVITLKHSYLPLVIR